MRRARYQGDLRRRLHAALPARSRDQSPAARRAGATPEPKKQDRGLNENYGREVMELHTVGVDAGYTQQDVIEMAEMPHRLDRPRAAPRSGILFRREIPRARARKS